MTILIIVPMIAVINARITPKEAAPEYISFPNPD
jgi:hypothetical protein